MERRASRPGNPLCGMREFVDYTMLLRSRRVLQRVFLCIHETTRQWEEKLEKKADTVS